MTIPEINKERIQSIDFIRGIVMVLMAIDHVRVYSGLPAGGQEAGIFFTRWVTHFCAPAFVFLAGTSTYFYSRKVTLAEVTRYLLLRGALLIILELTVIRFFWTFNLDYAKFTLAGVIWMLGWCMIFLAPLIRLHPKTVGIIGLVIIFFQNAFAFIPNLLPESMRQSFGYFWEFIYSSGFAGPSGVTILYVIVPWIGVMAAGYGFGVILEMTRQRKILLLRIGVAAIVVFVLVGGAEVFASAQENSAPFIFALLNQRKYPASQLFLLMTLGPAILLLPFVEKTKGWFSKVMITFGRVPFFYYLMHILLIHLTALIVVWIREGELITSWYDTAPYTWMPEEHRWNLWLLYLVFLIDVTILYFLCGWYEKYKFNHPEKGWTKFI